MLADGSARYVDTAKMELLGLGFPRMKQRGIAMTLLKATSLLSACAVLTVAAVSAGSAQQPASPPAASPAPAAAAKAPAAPPAPAATPAVTVAAKPAKPLPPLRIKGMSFFVTSIGKGDGANIGGLDGADAHCAALAKAAGSTGTAWKAYLSTTAPGGDAGVNARDRVGKGPWRNARGTVIARSVEDLHGPGNKMTKDTVLSEKGDVISGRGDAVNMHDILTGADPSGMYSTAGGDTTCGNWTKNGEGSAIVGHHDRAGLKVNRHSISWNSSHGSRGCGQENLKSSGGAGLFYCFLAK
jgi:hypothetical protein